eukprot:g36606.t1
MIKTSGYEFDKPLNRVCRIFNRDKYRVLNAVSLVGYRSGSCSDYLCFLSAAILNASLLVPQVPEIINTIRQAGKTVRQEETQIRAHDDDSFAQKYEVLFVGKVTVAHKKAPPALIDECIEKFNHVRKHNTECRKGEMEQKRTERPRAEHSRFFTSKLPTPLVQKRNKSAPKLTIQDELPVTQSQSCLEKSDSLDLNSSSNCDGAKSGGLLEARKRAVSAPNIVQPTNVKANRTMLFTRIVNAPSLSIFKAAIDRQAFVFINETRDIENEQEGGAEVE